MTTMTADEWAERRLNELRLRCTEALIVDRGRELFYGCMNDDQEQYKRNVEMYAKLLVDAADIVARALLKKEQGA